MYHHYPSYYPKFCCTASSCTDNCCIGWEIEIDSASMKRYEGASGEIGHRLRKNISKSQNRCYFRLQGERCPFLNDQNLCDIYIQLGEDFLCEICTEHPRFHEWYGPRKESGLGLCCEAAAQLIFRQPTPLLFETHHTDEPVEETIDKTWLSVLLQAREGALFFLQQGTFSIQQRLSLLLTYGHELQQAIDLEDTNKIAQLAADYHHYEFLKQLVSQHHISFPFEDRVHAAHDILTLYSSLECIDPMWPSLLQKINENLPDILHSHKALVCLRPECLLEYEQLAVYFIFRYFLKCLFDGDVWSRIVLAVSSCIVLFLLDSEHWITSGDFSLKDRIRLAKAYSKEIEYSEENLDALAEAAWQLECFSKNTLLSLLTP